MGGPPKIDIRDLKERQIDDPSGGTRRNGHRHHKHVAAIELDEYLAVLCRDLLVGNQENELLFAARKR